MSAEDFVHDILVNGIGTKLMVVGYDHRFGKNREGALPELKQLATVYDFKVEEISAEDIDEVTISSTKVRNALLEGDLKTANAFLGYSYRIQGTVVHGHKRGRGLGFPTANIRIDNPYKLVPSDGVYAVEAIVRGQVFKGMANIGSQPTFSNGNHAFEVNIFDFSQEVYGEAIEVVFHHRLRDEMRFDNIEALRPHRRRPRQRLRALARPGLPRGVPRPGPRRPPDVDPRQHRRRRVPEPDLTPTLQRSLSDSAFPSDRNRLHQREIRSIAIADR
jgi:riboflavin kinase/FMN adenylyltransferase